MMLKQGLILREIGVPVYERGALIINVWLDLEERVRLEA